MIGMAIFGAACVCFAVSRYWLQQRQAAVAQVRIDAAVRFAVERATAPVTLAELTRRGMAPDLGRVIKLAAGDRIDSAGLTRSELAAIGYARACGCGLRPRAWQVVKLLLDAGAGPKLSYLRLAKDGTPCHPLYLPGDLLPQRWSAPPFIRRMGLAPSMMMRETL